MKIGPAVLAKWNGWETEGNRMTEGEMGVRKRKRAKERKWEEGWKEGQSKNKAVAEKQEFMRSVA